MNNTPPTRANLVVLKQMLNLIPRGMINRHARETGVEAKARSFTVLSHLSAMLPAVQTSILRFDAIIEERAARHQDAPIFKSLPGAGAAFSARLLAFFGSDREKYSCAAAIQKDSGVAPLTKQR